MRGVFAEWLVAAGMPVAVVAGAWALARPPATLPPDLDGLMAVLPYAVAGLGAALAAWFARGRLAAALLLVALAHGILDAAAPGRVGGGVGEDLGGQLVYPALALALPLNLLVCGLMPPGAPPLRVAGAVLAVAGAQALVVLLAYLGGGPAEALAEALHARPFAADWDAWTWLPQPALIAFALSGLALLALAGWRRTPVDLALPAVLAAGALALHAVGRGGLPALFFTAAALAPLAALLMDAWRMAFIDDLTGLPGRRALNQSLRGLGRRYAIAMVDIDHFKAFNDTHGHDVGDQVLRMVAARLSRVGGGGRAHRYGGEEFAILFPGRTVDQTRPVLEALRAAMADEPFRLRGPTRRRPEDEEAGRRRRGSGAESPGVRVTVSIGVAERTGDKPTPQAVIQAADRALYQAKRVGRNRVVADRAGLEGVLSPAA